jgi:membrane associated rhomboid family serine protease
MFIIQNTLENATIYFGLNIYFFQYELYHQLISSMFVHGGIFHIFMNMFVLYQFGTQIEHAIGKFGYILLYLIGGIFTSAGTLAYMYFTGDWANVIGASGAICVLLGWYALKVPPQRSGIIIWVLLISFAPVLLGFPIAWHAHLIGFAIGWIMGFII